MGSEASLVPGGCCGFTDSLKKQRCAASSHLQALRQALGRRLLHLRPRRGRARGRQQLGPQPRPQGAEVVFQGVKAPLPGAGAESGEGVQLGLAARQLEAEGKDLTAS